MTPENTNRQPFRLVMIAAWFAILFTGRSPRGMFACVQGVIRWNVRVAGYALVIVTDQFPPFRLAPDLTGPMVAARGSRSARPGGCTSAVSAGRHRDGHTIRIPPLAYKPGLAGLHNA